MRKFGFSGMARDRSQRSVMNILFIGADGTVGRQVAPILKQRFNLTLAALDSGEVAGLPVTAVDITDMAALEAVVNAGTAQGKPFDAIVNCAIADYRDPARYSHEGRHVYTESCIEINARGAYHVFEAAARAEVPRVVYISSMTAVLGPPLLKVIDKTTRDQPNSMYAVCKMFGEHTGRYYAYRPAEEGAQVQAICLRLGQPYKSFLEIDDTWPTNPERYLVTHADDIAHAIGRSLEVDLQFGVFTIVSQSDLPFVDPKVNAELGYKPRWNFTAEGILPIE
jgi:nucleoside-diphosphate-sugar epimerase